MNLWHKKGTQRSVVCSRKRKDKDHIIERDEGIAHVPIAHEL